METEQGGKGRKLVTPLSLARGALFGDGELPPLYLDTRDSAATKPKWKLVSGVGPAGVELDKSRSGRLYKPSLRPVGITTPDYNKDRTGTPQDHVHACQCVEKKLLLAAEKGDSVFDEYVSALLSQQGPLFPLLNGGCDADAVLDNLLPDMSYC